MAEYIANIKALNADKIGCNPYDTAEFHKKWTLLDLFFSYYA